MKRDRPYRFLFVSAPFGGIEVFTKNIEKVVQQRNDIEASWMWIDFNPTDFIAHVPPISMNWTLKGGLIARQRLKKLEQEGKKFDAAFFNHTIPLMFLRKFRRKVPVVLSLDITPKLMDPYSKWYQGKQTDSTSKMAWLKNMLIRNIYMDVATILPWSELVKKSLIREYGVSEEKINVVPPGIDITQWDHSLYRFDRKETKDAKIHILFVGGDFKRKGGDIVARVASRKGFEHCEFHFVTRSFEGIVSETVHVYDNISANSDQLLALYKKADIFVLPTRADLSPAAICEAMAFQLPVVATNVGGLDEIVLDGETGYIVPSDNEEAFMTKLLQLIQSPNLRQSFGKKGRQIVEHKYDIEKNAGVVLELMKTKTVDKVVH